MLRGSYSVFLSCFGLGFFLHAPVAQAAVTEPNGIVVPAAPYMGETSLQAFFDSLGETIDASADASIAPATFWPRCGTLEVRLVSSQSQGVCGLAWYNVPSNATSVPSTVYTVFPVGGPGTVSNIDIANDPNYAGGAIGFALLKSISGGAALPIYYSEYQRNAFCSGCTAPDYWKMMLAYPSDIAAGAYYLAFEDWEGAGATNWAGNDGDFNDKVFRVRGALPCGTTCPTSCGGGAGGGGAGGAGNAGAGVGNGGASGSGIIGGGRTGSGGNGGTTSTGGSDSSGAAGEDGVAGETSGGTTSTGGRGGTANGGTGATDGGVPGNAGEDGVGGEPSGGDSGAGSGDDDDFDDDTNDSGGCGCSTVGASGGALGSYAVLALLVFARRLRSKNVRPRAVRF